MSFETFFSLITWGVCKKRKYCFSFLFPVQLVYFPVQVVIQGQDQALTIPKFTKIWNLYYLLFEPGKYCIIDDCASSTIMT